MIHENKLRTETSVLHKYVFRFESGEVRYSYWPFTFIHAGRSCRWSWLYLRKVPKKEQYSEDEISLFKCTWPGENGIATTTTFTGMPEKL